jgi:Fic family protein
MKLLTDKYFDAYQSALTLDIEKAFNNIGQKELSVDNFKFFTAVSVMASSKIEGETLEIDSYLKHKLHDVKYLPNLTEKPNDLYKAYEFARDNALTLANFLQAHSLATVHLLSASQPGKVRSGNMVIMEQHTNRIQYEAASSVIVNNEFESFWEELDVLISKELSVKEVFYYASIIHLVFVKIHPFNDGNGRTGRLLEKWFLATKLGAKASYIGSEYHYFHNVKEYYNNLARLGLFYEELQYDKCLPFLLMLPNSLQLEP